MLANVVQFSDFLAQSALCRSQGEMRQSGSQYYPTEFIDLKIRPLNTKAKIDSFQFRQTHTFDRFLTLFSNFKLFTLFHSHLNTSACTRDSLVDSSLDVEGEFQTFHQQIEFLRCIHFTLKVPLFDKAQRIKFENNTGNIKKNNNSS